MDQLSAGRALMGDSLGFHLLIIMFGVGLPVLISLLELYGLIKKKPRALALAKVWAKALAILFVVGAVSGTIVSLQFDLVWPKFMSFVSKTVGLAFVLEGTMFMIEAVFLSIYLLSWNRVNRWLHWVFGLFIVVGSTGSALFITTANAFMNKPAGFQLDQAGNPININVADAIFTRASFVEVVHTLPAYLCGTALVMAAIYAWLYHKKRHEADRHWMKQVLAGLCAVGLLSGLALGITGDLSARYLHSEEPYKLAAAEGLMKTQKQAPLLIGGIVQEDSVKYAVPIPGMLSILAGHSINTEVQGLEATPRKDRPPVVIHYFFDAMVACGILIVILPLAFLAFYKWKPAWALGNPMLYGIVAAGFLAVAANEFGWLVTELGRQPYIIHGVMRVADAMTTSESVMHFAYLFPMFYILLLVALVIILRRTMNHNEVRK